jgi:5'(3')-deoxyribonucleotidase
MRLIFDMDGTLADFDGAGGIDKMNERGFFKNLDIYADVVKTLDTLNKAGYALYILSACIDTEYCKTEKLEWIENNLPFISKDNVILMNVGENKASEFVQATKTEITETDLLFDDYGKNLKDWYEAGGTSVKCGKVRKEERAFKQLIRFNSIETILTII